MPITQPKIYAPEMVGDNADVLPTGNLVGTIVDIDDSQKTRDGGYFMLKAVFRIEEPTQTKGLQHTEYFAIGYDEDPEGQLPETWNRRAGRSYCGAQHGLLACAGVDRTGNTQSDASRVLGQRVGLAVTHRLEPEKDRAGRPNPFAGQPRAEIRFFRLGEREIGLTDEAPKAARVPRVGGAAAPASPNGPVVSGTPGGVATLTCPKCRRATPRETFKEHVKACGTAQPATA